jgi:predicted nucleic acid-binding protein
LYWLMRDLFQQVWITPVIAAEIGLAQSMEQSAVFPGSDRLHEACGQGWLQIASEPAGTADTYQPLNPGVDAGEASAISYALQQTAADTQVLLLIDDRCGWRRHCLSPRRPCRVKAPSCRRELHQGQP